MDEDIDQLKELKEVWNKSHELVKEWKEEIVRLVDRYHGDIDVLKNAQLAAKESEVVWWNKHSKLIASVIIVSLLFLLINTSQFCGKIEFPFGGSYAGKECTQ
jgi:hypothetical protein